MHASWLNQVEIYFSVVQRKVVSPNDFTDLVEVRERLRGFEDRYNVTAQPFQRRFTTSDLDSLGQPRRAHLGSPRRILHHPGNVINPDGLTTQTTIVGFMDHHVETTARIRHDEHCARWDVFEIELDGPSHGNPFTDVELGATFSDGQRELRVGGFYDGDGTYRIRFMPDIEGSWTFVTSSTARSLDGLSGDFLTGPAAPGLHGPVRVAERHHFAYADGTRYLPIGTTAYAWTHQVERLRAATRRTLAASGFTKVRMCLLPKAYAYNTDEPELYPFPGSVAAGWDTTRFDPRFFRRFEEEVRALRELGIEADVILFHPYDRWGFAQLGRDADDRLTRYAVRRLSALSNVWWSMANEYDLVEAKSEADWERLAGIVGRRGPARSPDLHPQLRPVLRLREAVDHPLQHPARRRLPHRGEHRHLAGTVGQARS